MTSEESKGGKGEKSVEVDTDLSWDHEGLKPLPKAPKDRLNQSPKPLRAPKIYKEGKYPEIPHKENKDRKEVPPKKTRTLV